MTTIAHTLSASIVALTATNTPATDTTAIILALTSGALPDLDHPIMMFLHRKEFKKIGYKGNLHHARSPFHELFGLLTAGVGVVILYVLGFPYAQLIFFAVSIHLIEDIIVGISRPFYPVDHKVLKLFSFRFRDKAIFDALIIGISLFLWALYLNGQL